MHTYFELLDKASKQPIGFRCTSCGDKFLNGNPPPEAQIIVGKQITGDEVDAIMGPPPAINPLMMLLNAILGSRIMPTEQPLTPAQLLPPPKVRPEWDINRGLTDVHWLTDRVFTLLGPSRDEEDNHADYRLFDASGAEVGVQKVQTQTRVVDLLPGEAWKTEVFFDADQDLQDGDVNRFDRHFEAQSGLVLHVERRHRHTIIKDRDGRRLREECTTILTKTMLQPGLSPTADFRKELINQHDHTDDMDMPEMDDLPGGVMVLEIGPEGIQFQPMAQA